MNRKKISQVGLRTSGENPEEEENDEENEKNDIESAPPVSVPVQEEKTKNTFQN